MTTLMMVYPLQGMIRIMVEKCSDTCQHKIKFVLTFTKFSRNLHCITTAYFYSDDWLSEPYNPIIYPLSRGPLGYLRQALPPIASAAIIQEW